MSTSEKKLGWIVAFGVLLLMVSAARAAFGETATVTLKVRGMV